ncbi:uncharacterized protein LOC135117345 [Helicoverpa armigera]|uniref:uncharacterized protein LOC135117345 n=1 Tax=Helicoverpa armigera TaxID=29058 RepID=UPI00308311CF
MLRSPDKSQSNPDIAGSIEIVGNVTQRKRKQPESEFAEAIRTLSQEINKKLDDWRGELECAISKITDSVTIIKADLATVTQVTSDIKTDLDSLRCEYTGLDNKVCSLDAKHNGLVKDVETLGNSVQYTMDEQDDLKKKMELIRSVNTETITDMIGGLEAKIDSLEQQARQCNLEICNVPELRNENLITLMENICTKIQFKLCAKDILAIHRVPHAHTENKKPKNIIVKLSSRILRDNLLSAYRLGKGLDTNQLQLTGSPNPIYLHEHLTLKKKLLFRQCKDAAVKNNFKYVWVKHATILVREIDSEPAIAIRSEKDISKIKPKMAKFKPGTDHV